MKKPLTAFASGRMPLLLVALAAATGMTARADYVWNNTSGGDWGEADESDNSLKNWDGTGNWVINKNGKYTVTFSKAVTTTGDGLWLENGAYPDNLVTFALADNAAEDTALTIAGKLTVGGYGGDGSLLLKSGTYATASGANILIGDHADHPGRLEVGGGALNVGGQFLFVGHLENASGTLVVSDGKLTASDTIRVGNGKNATGTMEVSGGEVETKYLFSGQEEGTKGILNLSGGTVKATSELKLGVNGTSTTELNVSGNAVLMTDNINMTLGGAGVMTTKISGGIIKAEGKEIFVGSGGGTNTVEMTGGTVTAENIFVGFTNNGKGKFVQKGGTITATGTTYGLGVGYNDDNPVGEVEISGGTMTLGQMSLANYGGAGSATFTVSGDGVVHVDGSDMVIGSRGAATLTMNGGFLRNGYKGDDNDPNADHAKWTKLFNGSTLDLNGGEMSVCSIRNADTSANTINCNGGQLTSYGVGNYGDIIGGDNNSNFKVNIKAGGLIVSVPENITTTIPVALTGDGSCMGGITKKGAGTLKVTSTIGAKGWLKVEEGTLDLSDATITGFDKIEVADGATLKLPESANLTVRSLSGTVSQGTVAQMSETPVLYKAVWTNAHGDNDAANAANWAVYYKSGETDVQVSADELPTEAMAVTMSGTAGTDYEFENLWFNVEGGNATVTGSVIVTVNDDGTVEPVTVSGTLTLGSAAKLVIRNAKNLKTGTATEVVKATGGITGAFASVDTGDYSGLVEATAGENSVSVKRRGGLILIIR